MKTSDFPIFTVKNEPSDSEVTSHKLMIKSGMIRKVSSGQYNWLPMGYRVLEKIKNIIREELNSIGCREILMPIVQPSELWKESGRWDKYGPELLRFKDRHDREFCFGPTFEEVVTDLIRQDLSSYKQLPINVFQISTKFRDEIRPRFGVMRAREFIMKDAYSFHTDSKSLDDTYNKYKNAYNEIFKRLMLDFTMVDADSGNIGGSESHEFHVIADTGEDEILLDESLNGMNTEIAMKKFNETDVKKIIEKTGMKLKKGIEVGHIFKLGKKYSEAMNVRVSDKDSKLKTVHMGCYGIGVSRIVAAAIEQNYDEKGIVWTDSISPFKVVLIDIDSQKNEDIKSYSEKIYSNLISKNIDVIYDDRDLNLGKKLTDWELIGVPNMLIVGNKETEKEKLTYKNRATDKKEEVPLNFLDDKRFKN